MVGNNYGSIWSEDRQALYALISDIHPTLAGLYRQAIVLMSEPAESGEERSRLALVGHCFREIMNRMPDALHDVDGFPGSNRHEEDNACKCLMVAFEETQGMPIDQPAPLVSSDLVLTEVVSVPKSLIDAVSRFVAAREKGSRNVDERDSVTVLGVIDPLAPALKPWRAARKFFMSCTHIDMQSVFEVDSDSIPDDGLVISHIEVVEASLRFRLGAFFDNYDELEGLIKKANTIINKKDES